MNHKQGRKNEQNDHTVWLFSKSPEKSGSCPFFIVLQKLVAVNLVQSWEAQKKFLV